MNARPYGTPDLHPALTPPPTPPRRPRRAWVWITIPVLFIVLAVAAVRIASPTGAQVEPRSPARSTTVAAEVTGTWVGSYLCLQGPTGLRLTISGSHASLRATFEFYALLDNQSVPCGSFTMTGAYDGTTLTLWHDRWINQPLFYDMVDISGSLSANGTILSGAIAHSGCGSFSVRRQ